MKKIYFTTLSLLLSLGLTAQKKIDPKGTIVINQSEKITNSSVLVDVVTNPNQQSVAPKQQRETERRGEINYSFIKIGNTKYDLQSNSAMGRRIILHPDGKITAVFTTATDNGFTQRGTGLNHFDGANWRPSGTGATQRIETTRTGWPSIGVLNGNQEFTLGHDATNGGFILAINASIGSTMFTESTVLKEPNARPIWARAASNGQNYLHVISNYADSSAAGEPPAPRINGVRAPLTYARSADAGATWQLFGSVKSSGVGLVDGSYTNIPLTTTGTGKGATANFEVTANAVQNFEINNYGSGHKLGDVLSLRGRVNNVEATLDSATSTIVLSNPIANLIIGSTVTGNVFGGLDANTSIVAVLNDSTIEVSPTPLLSTLDTLTITPPYGNSRFFNFTFERDKTTLPGYDSTRWITGSADNYAIDVRDSIVAIVSGRLGTDVMLWKSTNNGATFSKMFVDSFPYAPFDGKQLALDTPFCSDGTMDVLIDPSGNCHVWFGLSRVLEDDTLTDGFSFYPGTAGLVYWNEVTNNQTLIANGNMFDRDGDEAYQILAGTVNALQSGNIPNGLFSVARLGNTGVIRQPSAGMDANGNLFVVYSVPVEADIDANNLNYRDIFIQSSTDGGATWSAPQNITQRLQRESDFASIAKVVNDFVHVIFQDDETPGTNLQNNSASANNHPISDAGNDIYYAAIPVSEILAGTIGNQWGLNVKNLDNAAKLFVVSQNSPNPFSGNTDVTIYLNNFSSNVNLSVSDITGKVVMSNNIKNMEAGNHILTIEASHLKPGIYFYTLTSGANTITKKMIVE